MVYLVDCMVALDSLAHVFWHEMMVSPFIDMYSSDLLTLGYLCFYTFFVFNITPTLTQSLPQRDLFKSIS